MIFPCPVRTPALRMAKGRGRGILFQRLTNHLQHDFHILQDFMIPESQHSKPLIAQPSIPHGITNTPLMLTTIHLHNQPRIKVDEIHNVSAQWLLSAEFPTIKAMRPQSEPECFFSLRHITAQMFCKAPQTHNQ